MTTITFTKATKKKLKLRLAFDGPSGAGKTMTALRVARGLVGPQGRICVIDTERGSASLYSDAHEFDVFEMTDQFHPRRYVEAIHAAEEAGYDAIIVDSLSHAWEGTGGALELVDRAAARSRSGNSFTAWREVTPEHNGLVNAILQSPAHVIVTMRTKTEWVLEEDERGRKVPKKVGMAPVQRQGIEYEMSVVADLDQAHTCSISKTRAQVLDGKVFRPATEELGQILRSWLDSGAEAPTIPPAPASTSTEAPPPAPVISAPVPGGVASMTAPPAPAGPTPPPEPQTWEEAVEQSLVVTLEGQLCEAKDEGALTVTATVIAAAFAAKQITGTERRKLADVYVARKKALQATQAAA